MTSTHVHSAELQKHQQSIRAQTSMVIQQKQYCHIETRNLNMTEEIACTYIGILYLCLHPNRKLGDINTEDNIIGLSGWTTIRDSREFFLLTVCVTILSAQPGEEGFFPLSVYQLTSSHRSKETIVIIIILSFLKFV